MLKLHLKHVGRNTLNKKLSAKQKIILVIKFFIYSFIFLALAFFFLIYLLSIEEDTYTDVGSKFDAEMVIGKTKQEIINLYGDFNFIRRSYDENGPIESNDFEAFYVAFSRRHPVELIHDPPEEYGYWLYFVDGVVVKVELERVPGG